MSETLPPADLPVVVDEHGCWIWQRSRNVEGYGVIYGLCPCGEGRKHFKAHRVVYERLVGPIPDGLVIDHLCRVHPCVNPAHLEAVTIGENSRRGASPWGSTQHCKQGHEFTPENTRIRPNGRRRCITCINLENAAYRARKRAAQ